MILHQYFYDFYDSPLGISSLTHSSQRSWNVGQLLDQSMILSMDYLDLGEVQRRGLVNLCVTWTTGRNSGTINTWRVFENSGRIEEKKMQEAFMANFDIYDIPEILATPCCSQIAVTKEKIKSVLRAQYQHRVD